MDHPLGEYESAEDEASQAAEPATNLPGHVPKSLGLEPLEAGRYGTAEVAASGIDRSQLRRNLRLTPAERVEQMVAFVRFVLPLQGALRWRR